MSKDVLFKKEKESARTPARCHVSLEKSSKTIFVVKVSQAKPPLIASTPPHLLAKRRVLRADFPPGEAKCARKRRRGNSPWPLATWRGEGGVIWGLISFDNGSIVLRPIQHESGQCLYSGARLYKRPRTATRPQSTTLHSTGNISV